MQYIVNALQCPGHQRPLQKCLLQFGVSDLPKEVAKFVNAFQHDPHIPAQDLGLAQELGLACKGLRLSCRLYRTCTCIQI